MSLQIVETERKLTNLLYLLLELHDFVFTMI